VSTRSKRREGFTLIEIMAVVALIGFVFYVALNFYSELARATARASDNTRGVRRASAILDRVARDLEGAFLMMKPPEVDPFSFPWIFLGQTRLGGDTSDRLKFITRNHDPTRTDGAETNLAVVAYITESGEDDSISLYRWSSPRLPESLDKDFPREDDEGAYLLAEGLRYFGFFFVSEDGDLRGEWDSSTLLESSSLPRAVGIQLSLMPDGEETEEEPPIYQRKVLLPVRPIDLAKLLDPASALGGNGEDDDAENEDGEDGEDDSGGSGGKKKPGELEELTNADCFPTSMPASASPEAQSWLRLALRVPQLAFGPAEYAVLPESVKAFVKPKCRF